MKKTLKDKFEALYKGKRLLAIQLNGFSHKVFYDNGSKRDPITIEETSAYTCNGEISRETDKTKELFKGIGHYSYQGDPLEIIYIKPNER